MLICFSTPTFHSNVRPLATIDIPSIFANEIESKKLKHVPVTKKKILVETKW